MEMQKQHRLTAWMMTLLFGTVYCLISLVNHYQFRTFGLDLGIYTHGIYCYSHLHWHNFTLGLEGIEINHLGNHFSPIVALVSPLYYLFGTYTLLLVQIAAILFGGWGVYLFAKERLDGWFPELVMLLFYSIWGIYSALGYDFHANVLAAMFVPWFILYFERADRKMSILFFALILICKENMAVWMSAILVGLLLKQCFVGDIRRYGPFGAILLGISVVYFGIVQMVIMPALNPQGISNHLGNYSHLGHGPVEVMKTMITQPRYMFYLLFESLKVDEYSFKLKTQLHFMVLMSGGLALLYRPHFLVMLAPIYAQKLLSSNQAHWGVYDHYSIEFAPIIALAFVEWMQHFPFKKWRMAVTIATIGTATLFNWHPIGPNVGFFLPSHYNAGLNVPAVNRALELIPADATVSAANVLAPHLAGRDKIYLYPVLKDAEYIAILTDKRDPYPFLSKDWQQHLAEVRSNPDYEILHDADYVLIAKKRINVSGNP